MLVNISFYTYAAAKQGADKNSGYGNTFGQHITRFYYLQK